MKKTTGRTYNGPYENEYLNQVAFPLGGIGAGMICLEGTGAFSHVSLRHRPEVLHEPIMFAALYVKGARTARLLEGPVPMRKAFGHPKSGAHPEIGCPPYGLPHFAEASFTARFPFGIVNLADPTMPVAAELTGWSPFTPGDADSSSLPAAGLEYRLRNRTNKTVEGVFSFHARDFMRANDNTIGTVSPMKNGFLLGLPNVPSMSPYVAGWRISRLFPIGQGIAQAPCVRLEDNLDWKRATMNGYFADAYERFGSADGFTYIGTRVRVATAGRWVFSIGHDGGMRLFVDGRPVAAQAGRENPHRHGRTEVIVSLDAGEHEIMFAFELCGFGWGVSLSFDLPPDVAKPGKPGFPTPDQWGSQAATPTGQFAAFTLSSGVKTDCAWFRGPIFDTPTMLWRNIASGRIQTKAPFAEGKTGDGGSFFVPFKLRAGAGQTIRVLLAWHVPGSGLCVGDGDNTACDCKRGPDEPAAYVPWYATRFKDIRAVSDYWRTNYDALRARSKLFSDSFYDTTLPPEVVEAVAANLTILKSPTVLRQHDGRLWGWEGCCDTAGCCHGSCTHVWNYAQALCHLFPDLERTLRETEFFVNQDDRGHQAFRASLPIRDRKSVV